MNAQESLDSISQSEAEWIRETAYWDAVSNRKTIIGTTRNLQNNGFSIEIIAKSLDMTIEQVKEIVNSNKTAV